MRSAITDRLSFDRAAPAFSLDARSMDPSPRGCCGQSDRFAHLGLGPSHRSDDVPTGTSRTNITRPSLRRGDRGGDGRRSAGAMPVCPRPTAALLQIRALRIRASARPPAQPRDSEGEGVRIGSRGRSAALVFVKTALARPETAPQSDACKAHSSGLGRVLTARSKSWWFTIRSMTGVRTCALDASAARSRGAP